MVASKRIQRTEPELEQASRYVCYEFCQVYRQIDRLATGAMAGNFTDRGYIDRDRRENIERSDVDAHIRMHLIAFRNLVGFFWRPKQPDDVVASDFLPDTDANYDLSEVSGRWKDYSDRFNKRAAHLTYQRGREAATWEPNAAGEWLLSVMGDFIRCLALYDERDGSSRSDWYAESHRYAERVMQHMDKEHAERIVWTPTGVLLMKRWTYHPALTFDPPPERNGPELVTPPSFSDLWRDSQRPR